jgi:hypothetical protein
MIKGSEDELIASDDPNSLVGQIPTISIEVCSINLLAGTLIPRAALSILIFAGEETIRLPEMRAQ